ncbi:von Willebrand factor A domain-containing protein 7-like [Betta splendens]|uniref:von Willebrand factor A domain-containing protein 7-like n=1 Tax=Betta splendens TaxID=158456 RepID=A0A6P7P544_BETSP|nr:von Willebrand factor A domain-containing protein 7-like [Betta splendens]
MDPASIESLHSALQAQELDKLSVMIKRLAPEPTEQEHPIEVPARAPPLGVAPVVSSLAQNARLESPTRFSVFLNNVLQIFRLSCSTSIMRQVLKLLVVVSLQNLILSFQPLFTFDGISLTHRDITQKAILRKTAEVCRDIGISEGWAFSLTIDDNLSADKVQSACSPAGTSSSTLSGVSFLTSITSVYLSNSYVDVRFLLSARRHFDDETFQEGRDLITEGLSAVKASVKMENFFTGRVTLGTIIHTLQDFYSHSNWVELGRTAPYSALIRPDQALQNLAGPTTPTCRNCAGENCDNNLLPEVLKQGLLTSGYFDPIFLSKPAGKCSHGGALDQTSRRDPVGGINKDTSGSSHGLLHQKAADMAVSATAELLQDIRLAVGDQTFLRFMGLSFAPVLCFVIDTTGSMSDDIDEAKRVSFSIIDGRRGTEQEPSGYILVPFNDPDFGPVTKTTNADVFKASISNLTAAGGGDEPEMCLSGLQLALTAAPPHSEIFVFTDAPAKDFVLKNTITALIESTKTKVTFMLTNVFAGRRRRMSQDVNQRALSPSNDQLYRDLAQKSGGQTIEVTKLSLSQATTVIEDSSVGAVVTIFQRVLDPGRPENFTFSVDGSLRHVIAYITGFSVLSYSITSPTGVSQSSIQSSGPLANITTTGNLHRLKLSTETQTGLWQISVNSMSSYSVKVTGQSSVSFIYDLVASYEGAHSDFSLMYGRPVTGNNVSLLVSVQGSDQAKVTEVTLFDSSGPTEVNGSLQSVGSGSFVVTFVSIPAGDYAVTLRGEEVSSTSKSLPISFQRQASTMFKTTSILVTTEVNKTNIEPGTTVSVPFAVATTSDGSVNKLFKVRANNDRSYASTSPGTVMIEAASGTRGTANGTITLTVPETAASGTDVTLTIEVEDEAATDINYSVLRFSVAAKVVDQSRPVCQVVSTSGICPSSSLCVSSQWIFIANITDGINGTGIGSITILQGNGSLSTSSVAGVGGENVTVATYNASCCSLSVELSVVDNVGNVGTCVGQARVNTITGEPTISTNVPATTATGNTTTTGGASMIMSSPLLVSVMVFYLWK